MAFCQQCGTQVYESSNFCSVCGMPNHRLPTQQQSYSPVSRQAAPASIGGPHHVAARGFAQMFGLHPSLAFLTFIVDWMLFGGEAVSLGTSLPFSVAVSVVLGSIAYKAQQKWYVDDKESALIKALMLALLTAIPTALPSFLYGAAGVVGFFRRKS